MKQQIKKNSERLKGVSFTNLVTLLTYQFKIDVIQNKIDINNYFNMSEGAISKLRYEILKDLKMRDEWKYYEKPLNKLKQNSLVSKESIKDKFINWISNIFSDKKQFKSN